MFRIIAAPFPPETSSLTPDVGTRSLCRVLRPSAVVMAMLLVFLTPLAARAQVENITPIHVVVERDGVSIQCRVGSASYPVKTVGKGQVLKADGQTSSMYRVEYPAGMSAFVKVEEASLGDAGKVVTLTRPSRLMAPNAEGGVSWWYLLEKELDAGTTFKLDKVVKGSDGKDAGYLVPAPVGSKGYIRRDFVRQATQAEIDAFLGKKDVPAPPPAPPTTPAKPEATPGTPDQATTPPPAPGTDPDAPGVTTINVKPADQQAPAVTPPTPPAGETPPSGAPAEKPVEIVTPPSTAPTPAPAAATPPKPVSSLKAVDADTLTKIYTDALKAPLDQVELDAVIAEFERTITSLKAEQGTERLQRQLEARVRVLKMRADLQATLRGANANGQALEQQAQQMNEELRRLESLRQYTVVGRLVASSVYDGRTLPLMYRVLSPEPTSTRTLAYVAPDATANLIDKVGKLVGVVGESRFDESLRLNIVVPSRVDLLGSVSSTTVTPGPVTPAPSTGPATPAPATPAPAVPTPDENK